MSGMIYRRKTFLGSSNTSSRIEPQLIVKRLGNHNRHSEGGHQHPLQDSTVKVQNGGEKFSPSSTSPFSNTGNTGIYNNDSEENRWKNYRTRCVWGIVMIILFTILLLAGHLPIVLMVVGIQTAIFKEVISVAHLKYKERKLPWFRTLNWYFLLATYYFLFGENLIQLFKDTVFSDAFLLPLATHHRFISFCLYMFGLIMFVLNLKKGHYKFQFNQFGLTHMTILLVICQAQFVIRNIFEGMFWFVLPVALVIWNDIMAYFFGFFFGRTPLIKISPKKTWEGFLGAFISTILFGLIISGFMAKFQYLTCPDLSVNAFSNLTCPTTTNHLFQLRSYKLPVAISGLLRLVLRIRVREAHLYPVQLHSLAFSIFASLIAPFGGFFASGFKRAFKVKDFSDSIPGHGGLTDRMDCQILMGLFIYLYFSSFLKNQPMTVGNVLEMAVSKLSTNDQRILYLKLQEYLIGQDLLDPLLLSAGQNV